ncbi:VOC family protein [Actinomycetospora straminea]|uniref:VOC family protein n=1 Tax=Actinomycetospora straminea TaxID=663607 RepID=A0ABP9ERF0_9PSEU|nr:VOC family protein [Actinomycetospora straminea]MDD7935489.1 VOC family protein [Actinomycetospora straminea]
MAIAPLTSVTLDCPDPAALASFYRDVAGGEIVYSSPEFVFLACAPLGLGFQRCEARAARWPDATEPLRVHLDFRVDSPDRLDELEARVVALGARRPSSQPRPGSWRVLLDPAGHPFCLTSVTG